MLDEDRLLTEPPHRIDATAVLPTFLGIGVQRGATTRAYQCIATR